MPASRQQLVELLEPVVTPTGHDLEDVTVEAAGRRSVVRVVIDRDGGVDLDAVADVSRAVSDALDAFDEREDGALGTYVLEVSSPGVSRPLTAPRHWRRNVGRLVTATLAAGGTVTGRVTAADDDAVVLDVDGAARTLAHDELSRGAVQVEFSRPGPADAEEDA